MAPHCLCITRRGCCPIWDSWRLGGAVGGGGAAPPGWQEHGTGGYRWTLKNLSNLSAKSFWSLLLRILSLAKARRNSAWFMLGTGLFSFMNFLHASRYGCHGSSDLLRGIGSMWIREFPGGCGWCCSLPRWLGRPLTWREPRWLPRESEGLVATPLKSRRNPSAIYSPNRLYVFKLFTFSLINHLSPKCLSKKYSKILIFVYQYLFSTFG